MSASLLVRDGYVVTMDGAQRVYAPGSVLVEDGRIRQVGAAEDVNRDARGVDRVIDARGSVVVPGLVDTHVHLAQALLRGLVPDNVRLLSWLKDWVWPLQGAYTPEDGRASAALCIVEMLKSGTTCFLESMLHTRYGFDAIAELVEQMGIRAALAKTVMDTPGYAGAPDVIHPGMQETADAALAEFRQMHDKWHGKADGRLQVWLGPRTPGACSDALYREIAGLARERDTGLTMHLAEVREDLDYFTSRKTTPARFVHERGLTGPRRVYAHGVWLDVDDFKLFAKTGTSIAHCPSSNLKLGSGLALVAEMLDQGVNVSLGCDGGPSNDTYDLLREIKLAVLLQKGMALNPRVLTWQDGLRMATVNGARALGLDREIGSLEAGKRADLILVDLGAPHLAPGVNPVSNLVYAAHGGDVSTVIIDGRIVVEERKILTAEEDRIQRDALRHAEAVLQRTGLRWQPTAPRGLS